MDKLLQRQFEAWRRKRRIRGKMSASEKSEKGSFSEQAGIFGHPALQKHL